MKIWAHTMVKNEGRWLWFSVSSVIDFVDKLLLWDTGSSDESVEIEKALVKKYGEKIIYKRREQSSAEDFTAVRREMLEATESDWFLMIDADEIWWRDSIFKLADFIQKKGEEYESVFVPTVNVVGDIFHYQDESAGRYKLGEKVGNYNLRAVKRNIPGLCSKGSHGVWGWADNTGKMIQDRKPEKIKFIDAPYLHTTFLKRSGNQIGDTKVVKRSKKLKHEIGNSFPPDYYYPEAFFAERPGFIVSPWQSMSGSFKTISYLQTPFRKIKRGVWKGRVGY